MNRSRPHRRSPPLGSLGLALLLHATLLAALLAAPASPARHTELHTKLQESIPVQWVTLAAPPSPAARTPRTLAHGPRAIRSPAHAVEIPAATPAQQAPSRIEVRDPSTQTPPRELEAITHERVEALRALPAIPAPGHTANLDASIARAGTLRATPVLTTLAPRLTSWRGADASCAGHPDVQAYTHLIRDRVYPYLGDREVTRTTALSGRITLNPAGRLVDIELLEGGDPALSRSTVAAFRAAAPFPAMSASVRCLADAPIRWNFRLHPTE